MANNNEQTDAQSKSMQNNLKEIDSQQHYLDKLGNAIKDQFKEAGKIITDFFSLSNAVSGVVEKTKEAVSQLKDVNTLLTEISKSNSSLSKSQLENVKNNAFTIAGKYGKTALDYLSEFKSASDAGYKNAEQIAELSTAIQSAGGITSDLANEYIRAADNAYKMNGSIQSLTAALDGANNITNRHSIDMTELAEAMSVVSSRASDSQMDIDETTAAVGTLLSVTKKGGEEIGNSFNGILMNLQHITGDANDGGDFIDESSLAKYEKACNELGVSLSTVRNGVVSLKEPMEILEELSEKYTRLEESDSRRANLLNSVGGGDRADALNAILENYSLYEEMLRDYNSGAGSMAADVEKTANSWEGSLQRLSSTFTKTIGNIADSDAFIKIINSLNGVVGVIDKVTGSIGSAGTIGLGAGLFSGIKNIGKCRMSVRISKNCFEYALHA